MFDQLIQDIRYAVRTLSRAPGFTLAAVVTLALGIGASALVFSMVNTVLIRPFPYSDPSRLVLLNENDVETHSPYVNTSYPNYVSWRDEARSFSDVAAFQTRTVSMRVSTEAAHADAVDVTANTFRTLGIAPILGRDFTNEEGLPGGPRAVMLSYDAWQSDLGGERAVVGRTVFINGAAHTVVGVMPKDFAFPENARLWLPLQLGGTENRGQRYLETIARLRDGVTVDQARAEMDQIAARLAAEFPGPNGQHTVILEGLQEGVTRRIRPVMMILLGAVGFVLLIACANVANLMLARAATRDREMAIRGAIGANRGRLIRQLLTESAMIALLGAGLGMLFGAWWLDLLVRSLPSDVPRWMQFRMDGTVLLFVAAVAMITAVMFGIMPALQAGRASVQGALKEGGRSTAGQQRARMRNVFVVAQVAAAIVLLVGATLVIRSVIAMQRVDPGFDQQGIVSMQMELPAARYSDESQIAGFYASLLEQVTSIPAVETAAAVSWFPIGGSTSTSNFTVEGIGEVTTEGAYKQGVSPDYFEAMGIPVLQGRPFTDADRLGAPHVAIINKNLADKYYPGENPIGKGIMFGATDEVPEYMTIVGVVANVNQRDINQPDIGVDIYEPMLQAPRSAMTLVVRSRGESNAIVSAVRQNLRAIDRDIAVFNTRTVEQTIAEATWDSRLNSALFAFFALGALLLAAIGLYGVIAYTVAQRTHEIGVRVALGATTDSVLRMVIGHGFRLTAIGIAIGIALSVALSNVLKAMLFGVSAQDPFTFTLVPLILGAVSLLASYVPARRATRVSPITALRTD